jgi:tetratricopeptide (TPR) repeat protein
MVQPVVRPETGEVKARTALLRHLVLLWAVVATPLLVWTASFEMFELPKSLALKLAAVVAALTMATGKRSLPVAKAMGFGPIGPSPGFPVAVSAPLLAFLGLGLVSTVLSPLPLTGLFGEYAGYQGWLHWLALGCLLVALAPVLSAPREARRFLTAGLLSLLLVSAYALIQLVDLDPVAWSVQGPVVRTFSTQGNPQFLGFLLVAGFVAALGPATAAAGISRAGWLAAVALLLTGLLSSGSRGALAGALAGAGVFFSLGCRWKHPSDPGAKTGNGLGIRGLLVACLTPVLACALLLPADRNPFPLLADRFASVLRGEDSRPRIWIGAARLVRTAPFFGHGPDSFASLGPRVQSADLWNYVWRGSPEKAHNELIQAAACNGIAGLGALLWLGAVFVRLAAAKSHDPLTAAAAAGLAGVLVPSLFGFLTCGPQAFLVVLGGLLLGRSRFAPADVRLWRAVFAVLAVSLAIHLHFAVAEAAMKTAVRSGGRGLDRALALRTPWAQRLLRAGDTLERGIFGSTIDGKIGSPPRGPALIDLGRIYSAALAVNPFSAYAHSDLARIALRDGRIGDALAGYTRARELAPFDAYLSMEHAQALMAAGRDADATTVLTGVIAQYPGFAEPYGMIGFLQLKRRDRVGAEENLKRSINLDWHGNSSAAFAAASNLAALYHQTGREAEAAWTAQRAQQLLPSQP